MRYTEKQLDRLVDDLNDERRDRELEEMRRLIKPKPALPRTPRKTTWPFMEQRPSA